MLTLILFFLNPTIPVDPEDSDIRINFEGSHGYNSYGGIWNIAEFNSAVHSEAVHPEKETMNLCFRANGLSEVGDQGWAGKQIRQHNFA